jgi:hypothetical protein
MNELTGTGLVSRRVELPESARTDFVAASPHQHARLRYLGVEVQEPLSSYEANRIIDQTNNDPAFADRIQSWENEKQALHPDLFRVPPRFAGLSAPAAPSVYARLEPSIIAPEPPPLRRPATRAPARAMSGPALLALLTVVLLAGVGAAGWFLLKTPWVLPLLRKTSIAALPITQNGGAPASAAVAAPAAVPLAGQSVARPPGAPGAGAVTPEEFARRVAVSQAQAVARYPSLGTANSEMNSRFIFRYKRMVSEHNARLQDPNWPLLLAEDCAAASGLKPGGSPATGTRTASRPH